MKKIKFITFVLIGLCLTFITACKKNKIPPTVEFTSPVVQGDAPILRLVNISVNITTAGKKTIDKVEWKEGRYFRSKGTFDYEGVNISGSGIINGEDGLDFSSKLDTLNDIFKFEKTDAVFSSTLPARYYATGIFDLTKRWTLGASLYYEDNADQNSALGVSLQWQPVKLIRLGAMYSANARKAASLGFQVTLTPGPAQVFFASDNLLNAFSPYSASNVNFRTGLGFIF